MQSLVVGKFGWRVTLLCAGLCAVVFCCTDYPAPAKGDRGSQAFLTENYSLAFGALRGLELNAKVNEITGVFLYL